ncbi:MAG TPA: ABC transporter substrate-binding protein, partial [Verrucomicrobiae bacterium]|nr:ABC transporter substrate-binding protein [Verrucomicrobiae bacterium]
MSALVAACGRTPELANGLRIGVTLEPPNLDPTQGAAAAVDEIVYANVFEGLTRIGADGAVKAALASDWQIANGGRSYRFQLQPNVRFHDGAPFDAAAVKFSLDRARAPDSLNAQRQAYEVIDAITIEDQTNVRFDLARASSDFLFNLALGDAVIVSPTSAASNATAPIGTGPFRFSRWAKGVFVDIERNAEYWGAAPALDRARFLFISEPSAAYAALLAGDIDGVPDFTAPELLGQIERDRRFRIAVGQSEGETILAINNGRAPFN